VAGQLGLGPESLRNWVKRAEIDGGKRPGVTTAEQQRNAELEREVEAIASLTASAPWPASGGPFLALGLPWSAMRQVQKHGEPGGPFDESADGGAVEANDEVALPVAGYGPVVGFGRSLADEDLVADEALGACTGTRPRDTKRTSGAQTGGELTTQGTSTLDKQCLVDRLVRNLHRRIIGEIELEPMGDLLGTPGRRPAPVLAPPVTATDPPNIRAGPVRPVRFRHGACETVLHVLGPAVRFLTTGPDQDHQSTDTSTTGRPSGFSSSR